MIIKRSPLEGMNMGKPDKVAIRELPELHTFDVRVAPGSLAHAAVNEALGMELPVKTGQMLSRSVSGGGVAHALCLAPDWWMIVGLQYVSLTISQDNHHFSMVDVSGQRTTIEIEGPNVREVIAQLWDQDLREKKFPVGSVSQGLMAKAPVIVCHIAPQRHYVMVRSSFALHLWKSLADAAEEWV